MAKKIVYEIEVDSTGAVTSIDKLTDSVDELNDAVETTGDELEDMGDKGKKGAKKAEGGVKSLTRGVGSFLKSLGLIAIAMKVFEVLSEALQKNKKFADGLSTATNAFQLVLGDIVETIIPPLEKGFKAIFEDPIGTIKDLGTAIKDNILTRFEGILELIPELGKAIKLAWDGDWAEAAEVAGNATLKVTLGVEDLATTIVDDLVPALAEYGTEVLKTAENITALDNALATSAARQEALRLAALQAAEEQRQIRDDESKSLAERLAANNEIAKILTKQALDEKAIAGESLKRAKLEVANGNSSIQAANALREAKNKLLEIDERLSGINSEQKVNDISLRKEALETVNARIDAETELANVTAELTSEKLANEISAIDQKLLATQEAGFTETQEYRDLIANKKITNAEYTVALGVETDKRKVNELKAQEEIKAARDASIQSGLSAASNFAGALQGLANTVFQNQLDGAKGNAEEEEKIRKKSFAANKALQIVNAVIGTAQAVISGFNAGASLGPAGVVMGPLMAALAGVTGGIQIAAIAASKYSPTGGGGGSSPRAVPAPPAIPSGDALTPNATFTGGANNLNTVGGGVEDPESVQPLVATVSITEIESVGSTVSEFENASLLEEEG